MSNLFALDKEFALCRGERGAYKAGGMQAGRWEGVERRWRKERAGEGPTGGRGRGTREAHIKHVAHVCDFGGVEAQRLVERGRPLPSQKAEHTRRVACGPGGGRGGASMRQRRMRQRASEGPNGYLEQGVHRARAERTLNIDIMSVTLDVSRLSGWLNVDASCGVDRRALEAGGVWAKTREGLGRPQRMQRAGESPNGDRWSMHVRSVP